MSSLIVDFRIALLSLVEHRRRMAFLMAAIAGVTALLVILNALATGVRTTLIETATTLSSGHLNVGGFFKVTGGLAAPAVTHSSEVVKAVEGIVPEAEYVVRRGRGWANVVSATDSMQAGINGIDIDNEARFNEAVSIVEGDVDDLAQPGTMLLFEEQAEKLGVRVGDAVTISAQTTRGVSNTLDLRIVAVAKNVGMLSKFNAYVPASAVRELYQYQDETTGAVMIYLKPEHLESLEAIAERLRSALDERGYRVMEPDARAFWEKFETVSRQGWTGQKLDVTTWEGELSFLTWTLDAINFLSFVLVLILVGIVVAGIMNTMWIAIRERTREIGTLRAIGMQRGNVVRMFLFESMLLGLFGAVVGAAAGWLTAWALTSAQIQVPLAVQLFLMSDKLRLVAEPAAVARAVALLTAVTAVASLYPALKAARLRPVDAMSHFG